MSTRAMAHSAVASGFRVSSIDAFGDLDHPPPVVVPARSDGSVCWRPARVPALASAVAPDASAVAYGSSLENHPQVVAALARGRALWGNPPDVLRRVRDPRLLSEVLRAHGYQAPEVLVPGTARPGGAPDAWLLKPLRSGGGRQVRHWKHGERVPASCYAQQFVDGTPGSLLFVAARGRGLPLGVTKQIVGDSAFGATAFRYCGSHLCSPGDAEAGPWRASAVGLVNTLASAFDLVGVCGVDFIARDGVMHSIEVNPRWTSSMELVERAWGRPLFAVHARACMDGQLPPPEADGFVTAPRRTFGKAIVFARCDVRLGDTRVWLNQDIADIPHPGTSLAAGHPVCSVFGGGVDEESCRRALVHRAGQIYDQLEQWQEAA